MDFICLQELHIEYTGGSNVDEDMPTSLGLVVLPKVKKLELSGSTAPYQMMSTISKLEAPKLENLSLILNRAERREAEPDMTSKFLGIPHFSSLRSLTLTVTVFQIPVLCFLDASAYRVEELIITVMTHDLPKGLHPSKYTTSDTNIENESFNRICTYLGREASMQRPAPFPNVHCLDVTLYIPDLYRTIEGPQTVVLDLLDCRKKTGAHPLHLKDIKYNVELINKREESTKGTEVPAWKLWFQATSIMIHDS